MNSTENTVPVLCWTEAGEAHTAHWRSESGHLPPRKVAICNDQTNADTAYKLAAAGTGLLWRGDFQHAKLLLQALSRRTERKHAGTIAAQSGTPGEAFDRHRQAQAQRARILAMLLLPMAGDYSIPLRRAPDIREACLDAYGPATGEARVVSLREVLGLIGAYEWRKKGVWIPELDARIHAHYGVFSPLRGEYLGLVAEAPLPTGSLAFDIGTGTGVLAAILARRGIARIVATDQDSRALACARENIARLGLQAQVEVVAADLFPPGRAALVVCNPPWLPAQPTSALEHAVYDPDSRMLHGFIAGLAAHLTADGEGWLVLSDIAEHLGLRTRAQLLASFAAAGLNVAGRHDVRPRHPRATDTTDPLHAARSAEVTSLWRLSARH